MQHSECSDVEIVADKSNFVQHGQLFHVKLMTLMLLRANHSGYESFRLSSELSEAYSFDDIVFCYKRNRGEDLLFRLLQVKSKETVSSKELDKIEESDLLSLEDKGDFALHQYFTSFLKVRNSCGDKFSSLFAGGKIEDVILITNTFFKSTDLEKHFIEKPNEDDLLEIDLQSSPGTRFYKIKYDEKTEFVKRLKTVLEAKSDNSELVSRLAKHLAEVSPIIGIQQKHFNEYRFALVRDVFEIHDQTSTKLKATFIENENVSLNLGTFRSSLFKEYKFLQEPFEGSFENFSIREFDSLLDEEKKIFVNSIGKNDDGIYSINTSEFDDLLANEIINVQSGAFQEKFLDKNESLISGRITELSEKRITSDKLKHIKFSLAPDIGGKKLPYDREVLLELAITLVAAMKCKFLGKFKEYIPAKFRKYIPALMTEVIDIKSKTFYRNFISKMDGNNKLHLSASAILFRQFVIDKYFDPNEVNKIALTFKDKKLAVSKGLFDNINSAKEPEISLEDSRTFANQLLLLVERPRRDDLVTVDNSAVNAINTKLSPKKTRIITHLGKKLSTFKKTMKSLAGHVFVERNRNIVFSQRFLSSEEVNESLKTLRDELRKSLTKQEVEDLKFSINILGFNFFKEDLFYRKLPIIAGQTDFEEFCEKFCFVINYPDRNQIKATIESDFQKIFKTHGVGLMQSKLETTIYDWSANRVRTFYDKPKTNEIFNSIENLTNLSELHGITRCYFSTIKKDLVYDGHIIQDFLGKNGDNKILHLANEDLELCRTLVVQSFRDLLEKDEELLREYTLKNGHVFFNLQLFSDDYEFKEQLFNIMRQECTPLKLIVIECSQSELVEIFWQDLNTLITFTKKVILVSRKVEDFGPLFEKVPKLHKICEKITKNVHFHEFILNLSEFFQEKLILS